MVLAGQLRNQVAEHVAGAGEAVQQQHDWSALVAGGTVEHLQAIDVDGVEADGHHAISWILRRRAALFEDDIVGLSGPTGQRLSSGSSLP